MTSRRNRLKKNRDVDRPGPRARAKAVAAELKKEERRMKNTEAQQRRRKRRRDELDLGQASNVAQPLSDRRKRSVCRTNALALLKSLEGRTAENQMDILAGTFDHPALESVRERAGLPTRKEAAVRDVVFQQTVSALEVLGGRGSLSADKSAAKNSILAASTGSPIKTKRLQRAMARVCKLRRSTVSRAINRRGQLNVGGSFWALTKRARRKDALPEETKLLVSAFWARNTRVSPNRKDVVRHRIGAKQYETHPAHLLEVSQVRRHSICHARLSFSLKAVVCTGQLGSQAPLCVTWTAGSVWDCNA